MESARLPNGMMDGAGGGGGMPGKPKGALPATPGCPLPGTALASLREEFVGWGTVRAWE